MSVGKKVLYKHSIRPETNVDSEEYCSKVSVGFV